VFSLDIPGCKQSVTWKRERRHGVQCVEEGEIDKVEALGEELLHKG